MIIIFVIKIIFNSISKYMQAIVKYFRLNRSVFILREYHNPLSLDIN